jgi:hypothetical protein
VRTFLIWTTQQPHARQAAVAQGLGQPQAIHNARLAGFLLPGEKASAIPLPVLSTGAQALRNSGRNAIRPDEVKDFTRNHEAV